MKTNKVIVSLGVLLIAGLFTIFQVSCSSNPTTNEVKNDLIGQAEKVRLQQIKDEISIGRTMASKLLGTYGVWKGRPATGEYVSLVGQTIVRQVGRPELNYHFVILDLEEPNAYATPGGFVFVTKGLLKLVQNESELAAILAHEIVHINHKHMYLKVAPQREVGTGETLTRILSRGAGDIGSSLSQAVGEGLKTLLENGLAHDSEYDSDTTAVIYTAAVGYDPTSLIAVLKQLKSYKGASLFEKTHPDYDARIQRIQQVLKENELKPGLRANGDVLNKRFAEAMKGIRS